MIGLIDEARNAGARLSKAADTVGLTCRTIQRWRQEGEVKGDARRKAASKRTPRNKLTEEERENILNVVNTAEFADKPPSQIVPILADRGQYLASESTIYRIMRESRQLVHRGKAKRPSRKRPEPLQADAPNQLWRSSRPVSPYYHKESDSYYVSLNRLAARGYYGLHPSLSRQQ